MLLINTGLIEQFPTVNFNAISDSNLKVIHHNGFPKSQFITVLIPATGYLSKNISNLKTEFSYGK